MPSVEIFTRDYCGFCTRAKQLLGAKGIAFTEYNASIDPGHRQTMVERSHRRTFPQIFVGEVHVGGCDELFAAERSGRLDKMLAGEIVQ